MIPTFTLHKLFGVCLLTRIVWIEVEVRLEGVELIIIKVRALGLGYGWA